MRLNKYTFKFIEPYNCMGYSITRDVVITDSYAKAAHILKLNYQMNECDYRLISTETVELFNYDVTRNDATPNEVEDER